MTALVPSPEAGMPHFQSACPHFPKNSVPTLNTMKQKVLRVLVLFLFYLRVYEGFVAACLAFVLVFSLILVEVLKFDPLYPFGLNLCYGVLPLASVICPAAL